MGVPQKLPTKARNLKVTEGHPKERAVKFSLFGEEHMVSSNDELKILVESHDLTFEDFGSIKLSPNSQLDCFSELSFGGTSSVDLDELLHQRVQSMHEDSTVQKDTKKETVSSSLEQKEEYSLTDLPQEVEKSISKYCRESRRSLTNGTCLPLPDGFPFGIGKPDDERSEPKDTVISTEQETVKTEPSSELHEPIMEDIKSPEIAGDVSVQ